MAGPVLFYRDQYLPDVGLKRMAQMRELADLIEHPEEVSAISQREAQEMLIKISRLQTALLIRAVVPAVENCSDEKLPDRDRLLTPEETGKRLGRSVRWIYRNAKNLPFAVKLSRKCLRFSEARLTKWIDQKLAMNRCSPSDKDRRRTP
ncbi:MAG: hypothetical protein A3G34_08080 [Candidatus Lindowbacteria bacterium RIFCSPLOWO2_12_FULL_62_27]|nr:MAG: hypothetical protein A3G34_08080 [Candidatus Lindowbacteria bacterium RIFCSPLOWO2_12_FULL_62_27]OGH62346.1 MAG: hypothetical protein A3I06_00345 [Candidatus Lindowbacteria bacterium RIFCSPLOWO2_02_FULL_62_12]